ncbi:helix-turn-helix domain-containing protein [Rathayibacter sp. YIM 133350]|uniref:TetR/AcrR family transcriptional regulator n=1 Tax=Rathayibacter sp. YIM 133350 TaxID=3131992 RepID=UPI00307DCFD6
MAGRGQYAKGVAKREEILTTALEVIARNGYRKTSVRELADAVGLSQAGLLHYFSSKEELFQEILRKRDELDTVSSEMTDLHSGLVSLVRHNAKVPGLVQLYAQLSTAATDADHPAHEFFRQRYATLREYIARDIAARPEASSLPAGVDGAKWATILAAVMDGLQTQWMLDPSIDMAAHMEYLVQIVGRSEAANTR